MDSAVAPNSGRSKQRSLQRKVGFLMVRNVYRRLFPTRPVLGGVLSVASLSVLVAAAFATTPGQGYEGSWDFVGVNPGNNTCSVVRQPDWCSNVVGTNSYCYYVAGGHHSKGTAPYNATTQTCDTAHTTPDANSDSLAHIKTISTTGGGIDDPIGAD